MFPEKWQKGYKNQIKRRLAADFTGWETDKKKFEKQFEQMVNLSNCKFYETFNSGDFEQSKVIYRKDLICNDAVFIGAAYFVALCCEGCGIFNNAEFANEAEEICFTGAYFQNSLEFQKTVFKGGATFNSVQTQGAGVFNNVDFRQDLPVFAAFRPGTQDWKDSFFALLSGRK